MWIKSTTFAAGLVFCATQGVPCAFHTYSPQPTLVDRLLGSEHIVLARTVPESPFRFTATVALEGALDYVEIPQLVDTVTRRRLANDDTATVLFARDGAYGPWERLAFVGTDFAPILDDILTRLPEWELGDDMDRFGFFAKLINHEDTAIQRLALRELDQADYSILRDLDIDIDIEVVADRVNLPAEVNEKPIRILLLGLSADKSVATWLKDGATASARVEGPFLGAYATALIENLGPPAVDWLAENMLRNPEVSDQAREQVVEAMAIQSISANEETRDKIGTVIAANLNDDPSLGPAIARQYGFRADWSHFETLQKLLSSRAFSKPSDIIAVSQYVALAAEFE